jgi:hypothetical protein
MFLWICISMIFIVLIRYIFWVIYAKMVGDGINDLKVYLVIGNDKFMRHLL